MVKYIKIIFHVILSISIVISSIIFFTKAIIDFKPLYYYDIINLNIEKSSSFDINTIKLNYDYLIQYLNSKNPNNFSLPTLASSNHGKIHFLEVYFLLNKLNLIFYAFLFISLVGFFITLKHKKFLYLKITGISLLSLPAFFTPLLFINFNKYFDLLHKVIFNNNYWLFNPSTDPIILILPEAFFLHCLVAIIICSALLGTFLMIIYYKLSHRKNNTLFLYDD